MGGASEKEVGREQDLTTTGGAEGTPRQVSGRTNKRYANIVSVKAREKAIATKEVGKKLQDPLLEVEVNTRVA